MVCKSIGHVELDCRKQYGGAIIRGRREAVTRRRREGDGFSNNENAIGKKHILPVCSISESEEDARPSGASESSKTTK